MSRQAIDNSGDRVASLLDALGGATVPASEVETLAPQTPAGRVLLPLALVSEAEAVAASADVDPDWLAEVGQRRGDARRALVAAGRSREMEAALRAALLLATERFDPTDGDGDGEDADEDDHVSSGARLWLVAGAVVSALGGMEPDPFAPWARLVAGGWWPVGPCRGQLVVGSPRG